MTGLRRLRIVIAGGGVAALETALALRTLAPELVDLTLVAPTDRFIQCAPTQTSSTRSFVYTQCKLHFVPFLGRLNPASLRKPYMSLGGLDDLSAEFRNV